MKKNTLFIAFMFTGLVQFQNLGFKVIAGASSELQPTSNAIDGITGNSWESVYDELKVISIDLWTSHDIGQILLNSENFFAVVTNDTSLIGTTKSVPTNWNIFENGNNSPSFEFATTPDSSGSYISENVGKFFLC